MHQLYWTKETLYNQVDSVKRSLGKDPTDIYFDAVALCEQIPNITVERAPFKTDGLKAMLVPYDGNFLIVLHSGLTYPERNFFCMHEFLHSRFHPAQIGTSIQCGDRIRPGQNRHYEWHANEGSAQFSVPYQRFIPDFCELLVTRSDCIRHTLAEKYGVTYQVIRNRIESLNYEIDQYMHGVPLSDIKILSHTQQKRLGLLVTSYNDVCDFELESRLDGLQEYRSNAFSA